MTFGNSGGTVDPHRRRTGTGSVMAAKGKQFHFISGLPRSGSTLTGAILRQNPAFHAGMSSPIAPLFEGILTQVSAGSEISSMVDEDQRARLLKGLFESYYADRSETVIFDTNRAWTAQLPALMRLFPEARVICLVRDLSWIMDSLEIQFRSNAFENTRLFNSSAERATVYSRVEALAGSNRLVGYAWHALREACYSEFADRVIIVEYDLLVRRAEEVMGLLYDFLGLPYYAHDFSSVDYDAPGFDAQLGLSGLHRVRKEVAPQPRETVLPPDLFAKYDNLAFWRALPGSSANRIVARGDDADRPPDSQMPAPMEGLA